MRQREEPLKCPAQVIGGHDEGHAGERVERLYGLEIINQRRFECGMEGAGNETQHLTRGANDQ